MSVLAIVPARSGSKGIPNKNFRPLAGRSLMNRAIDLCNELRGTLTDFVVTSDIDWNANARFCAEEPAWRYGQFLYAPAPLHQDDTPMIDVVRDALARIPGPPDQIIVLLQPTQPLRTPAHVQAAIALLRETQADSVVSVTPLPASHHPDMVCEVVLGGLVPYGPMIRMNPFAAETMVSDAELWALRPTRRQATKHLFRPEGTVYAFWRKTVDSGTIYGSDVRPLIIPPEETCELDTIQDWEALEARWRQRG